MLITQDDDGLAGESMLAVEDLSSVKGNMATQGGNTDGGSMLRFRNQSNLKQAIIRAEFESSRRKIARQPMPGYAQRKLMYSDAEITIRPYRNSSTFLQQTVIWLLMPVMLVFAYLVFAVVAQEYQRSTLSDVSNRMAAVQVARFHET